MKKKSAREKAYLGFMWIGGIILLILEYKIAMATGEPALTPILIYGMGLMFLGGSLSNEYGDYSYTPTKTKPRKELGKIDDEYIMYKTFQKNFRK